MYAEVALSRVAKYIDNIYHYSVPPSLKDKAKIGSQILIPFGSRKDIGYIVGFTEKTDVKKIKDIIDVTSEYPLFSKESVDLAKWLSEYYLSFFINALRAVMPPGTVAKEKTKLKDRKRRKKPQAPSAKSQEEIQIGKPLDATPDQKKALDLVFESLKKGEPETILLYGITGSGKTEVYLQTIAELLRQDKGSIVLVPEISLTPQLIERFRDRFKDHISIIHSHMTGKQRNSEWQRIVRGESKIVLGVRSAIFAPVKDLALIVIDEEYEMSYKQDQNPRYHARTVAEEISRTKGIPLILGSATPSVETFYKAEKGIYKKAVLPKRIDDKPLPPVEVIDMREEIKTNNRGVLSAKLKKEIKATLSRGEQIILFLNRRGYFTFVMCRECGYTVECPKCSVSLVYHSKDKKLRCNHCSFKSEAPIICPKCQSSSIRYFGTGTQRIEQEVADIFPNAKITRVDRDTVAKRGAHEEIFAAFKEGKSNVLIGTQMVTKGLDLANVTLVGVVAADTAFNIPDFRSAEHSFQLLTQVAGRAGRHHLPGKVIIQTYNPDHYAIQYASKHDYEGFYKEEIKLREELGYPPFQKLINILISGEEEKKSLKVAEDLMKFIEKRIGENSEALGPVPPAFSKIRGSYRYQILLKTEDLDKARKAVADSIEKVVRLKGVRVSVDVEPMNML